MADRSRRARKTISSDSAVGAAESNKSPTTSTTSTASAAAIPAISAKTATCSSARLRPRMVRPTCQSDVWRIFTLPTVASPYDRIRDPAGLTELRVQVVHNGTVYAAHSSRSLGQPPKRWRYSLEASTMAATRMGL